MESSATVGLAEQSRAYQQVARAIAFVRTNSPRQPRLAEVAAHVGLSESELQRRFSQWAGISPKRFLQYLTKEHAKRALREAPNVLEATYAAGLSSPGRLHDLLVASEAVSPGEHRAQGRGVEMRYGWAPTPFGEALAALTPRGVCKLAFIGTAGRDASRDELIAEWPLAAIRRDDAAAVDVTQRIFSDVPSAGPLHVWVRGSNFQIKVWEALLRVPPGELVSYGDLARAIGSPGAARAVGSAVGANPVAVLIPCHRVIRASGDLGDYRWGLERKATLIAHERATRADAARVSD
jgi:AraC family transcriptional regulator of adaptative response/methylated-DNA-[protein]-cysteine methyltransferase